MAPKPKPLHQGEIIIDHGFGSTDDQFSERPVEVRAFTPGHHQEQSHAPDYSNDERQGSDGQQRHSPPTKPTIHAPTQTTSWFLQKQQRDPAGHLAANQPPFNLEAKKSLDPPAKRRQTDVAGFMVREGDFLDRAFDNVENVTCHRTSLSKNPPPPIFAFDATKLLYTEAWDIAALSAAKQQGYNIEQYDENENVAQGEPLPSSSERPPLAPVNSIVDDQGSIGIMTSTKPYGDVTTQSDKRSDMLGYIFENVQSAMCREDRAITNGPENTRQVEIPHQHQQQPKSIVIEDDEDEDPTSRNFADKPNMDGLVNSSDNFLTKGKSSDQSESSSRMSANQREIFAPIWYEQQEGAASSSMSNPRKGMMLLADGSIVVPEELSNRWARQARSSGNFQHPQKNSIRLSRESSLLDTVSRSGNPSEDDTERLASLRQKKRSIERRVRTTGGTQTIIIPRHSYDEEEGPIESSSCEKSPVSVQDIERNQFWKQIALATTILLVACGLAIFALAFFWPAQGIR